MPRPYLLFGTKERAATVLVTDYLKNAAIFSVSTQTTPNGAIVLAGANGVFSPYTTGYVCLALNFKNGVGERTLTRNVLDILAQRGVVLQVTIGTGGTQGYTVGDILTLNGGNHDATVRVDSVGTRIIGMQTFLNAILTYHIVTGGSNYPESAAMAGLGGTGSGASFAVTSDIMQQPGGWWYDSYNPYLNTATTTFERITTDPTGRSGDLQVDSDASLLAWAMSDWDALTGGGSIRYAVAVQKALYWLYTLQQSHNTAYGTNLISNLIYQGVTDTTALTADCAEALRAFTRAMDAYGSTLYASIDPVATTAASVTGNVATLTFAVDPAPFFNNGNTVYISAFSGGDTYFNGSFVLTGVDSVAKTITFALPHANAVATSNGTVATTGISVKTIANNLYTSMTSSTWGGTANPIYRTSFPIGQNAAPPFSFNYVEPITYTQSMCARANYIFANSGYLTAINNSAQAELCLDFSYPRMAGQWGGQFYTPFNPSNLIQTDQIEHLAYTALMCMAMQTVNSTKYAPMISSMITAMRKRVVPGGIIFGQVHQDSSLWRALLSGVNIKPELESYGFVIIDIADALLAGV